MTKTITHRTNVIFCKILFKKMFGPIEPCSLPIAKSPSLQNISIKMQSNSTPTPLSRPKIRPWHPDLVGGKPLVCGVVGLRSSTGLVGQHIFISYNRLTWAVATLVSLFILIF